MFRIPQEIRDEILSAQQDGLADFDAVLLEKDLVLSFALQSVAQVISPSTDSITFGGGTALTKAWGLRHRLSEDIDLKLVTEQGVSKKQISRQLRNLRNSLIDHLLARGFGHSKDETGPFPGNFFGEEFTYESWFDSGFGPRPNIQVECKAQVRYSEPVVKQIRTILGFERKDLEPQCELSCTAVEEIAAQKLWLSSRALDRLPLFPKEYRHLLDLWKLQSLNLDWEIVTHVYSEQIRDRGAGLDPEILTKGLMHQSHAAAYSAELMPLTPQLPPYLEVIGNLRVIFERVKGAGAGRL